MLRAKRQSKCVCVCVCVYTRYHLLISYSNPPRLILCLVAIATSLRGVAMHTSDLTTSMATRCYARATLHMSNSVTYTVCLVRVHMGMY